MQRERGSHLSTMKERMLGENGDDAYGFDSLLENEEQEAGAFHLLMGMDEEYEAE